MSTLEVKELSHPAGEVIKIAAGKTLDLKTQGSVTMPTGSLLQTMQSGTIARTTVTASAWIDTNVVLSITPSSTSSEILITVNQPLLVAGSTPMRGGLRLLRGSTVIWNTYGFNEHFQVRNADNEHSTVVNINQLDSPSTTSTVTYKVQVYMLTGTQVIAWESAMGTNMILQEIQG